MNQRQIGDRTVGAIGLGCMGMSFAYGPSDENECLSVLSRSLELGSNHWDTADMYAAGVNEKLVARALKGKRDQVFLATKFGNVYDRALTSHQDQVASSEPWIVDGTPAYVRKCVELSLQRLETDHIDLYYQHRVDPKVPVEETWGEMKKLVEEGKVLHLGISEARADTIRRAHAVHPVTALQSEYSLWSRDPEPEILPTLCELGIKMVPYSPLGRGFLTGAFKSPADLSPDDWRRTGPRWQEETFAKNMAIVEKVKAVAERHEATNAQVALAWVLSRGEDMLPIPGTKRLRYLEDNVRADDVTLTEQDIADLDGVVAVGERYAAVGAKFLNG